VERPLLLAAGHWTCVQFHSKRKCTPSRLVYRYSLTEEGAVKRGSAPLYWSEFYVEATRRNLSLDKITAPCRDGLCRFWRRTRVLQCTR
jgi:hypothetical protein